MQIHFLDQAFYPRGAFSPGVPIGIRFMAWALAPVLALVLYSTYLGIQALATVFALSPWAVLAILVLLTAELTMTFPDGPRRLALLPWRPVRAGILVAAGLLAQWHYAETRQGLELAVMACSALLGVVMYLLGQYLKGLLARRTAEFDTMMQRIREARRGIRHPDDNNAAHS